MLDGEIKKETFPGTGQIEEEKRPWRMEKYRDTSLFFEKKMIKEFKVFFLFVRNYGNSGNLPGNEVSRLKNVLSIEFFLFFNYNKHMVKEKNEYRFARVKEKE